MNTSSSSVLARGLVSARALVVASAVCAGAPALAQVVLGPVASPNGPSRYYVIQASNWNAARAQALAMGGDLATIEDATENAFVLENLTNAGTRKLFLGLSDAATEGTYAWADGSGSAYRNWRPGQPVSNATNDYVVMQPADAGRWDVVIANYTAYALVEVRGPLRVPQEIPTLEAALDAMEDAQVGEIVLAPGVHLTSGSPAAHTGIGTKITGAGDGATIVRNSAGDTAPLAWLMGRWDVQGVTFHNTSPEVSQAVRLSGSSSVVALRGCELISSAERVALEVSGEVTLERCRIEGFEHGGFLNLNADLTVVNSSIDVSSRALYFNYSTASFFNCVVRGEMELGSSGRINIRNSIVQGRIEGRPETISVQYSNVIPAVSGTGNISRDPMFVDLGDFRLRPGSPCIDAGSVTELCAVLAKCTSLADLGGEFRTIDDPATSDTGVGTPAVDMGCFEYRPSVCGADYNGDLIVDFFDYLDFVAAFDTGC